MQWLHSSISTIAIDFYEVVGFTLGSLILAFCSAMLGWNIFVAVSWQSLGAGKYGEFYEKKGKCKCKSYCRYSCKGGKRKWQPVIPLNMYYQGSLKWWPSDRLRLLVSCQRQHCEEWLKIKPSPLYILGQKHLLTLISYVKCCPS